MKPLTPFKQVTQKGAVVGLYTRKQMEAFQEEFRALVAERDRRIVELTLRLADADRVITEGAGAFERSAANMRGYLRAMAGEGAGDAAEPGTADAAVAEPAG